MGRRPAAASAWAAASCPYPSAMWKVPAKASRGSTERSRSFGSRVSSMLTLSWAPSGAGGGGSPSRAARSLGEALTRTWPAWTVPSPSAVRYVTSARRPSVSMRVTSWPVRRWAPAAWAASARASVRAPMPPTGTSQSPVPPPMTWYRKQRFWSRVGSWASAKVPMRASVRTTPRTRSSAKVRSRVAPRGSSKSIRQVSASSTRARSSARVGSGSVRVGKIRRAARPVRA